LEQRNLEAATSQIMPNPLGACGTAKSLGSLCTWALSHGKCSAADEETRGAPASLRRAEEILHTLLKPFQP